MSNDLAIESTVYCCNFFLEINSHWSNYAPEDSQHNLLYWTLRSKYFFIFLYRIVSVFPLHKRSFRLWLINTISILFGRIARLTHVDIIWKNLFLLKHLRTYPTFFCKFLLCLLFSVNKNLITDLCSSLEHFIRFAAISNGLKKYFHEIRKNCSKTITNNAEFIYTGKNSEKKKYFAFLKKFPYFINTFLIKGKIQRLKHREL